MHAHMYVCVCVCACVCVCMYVCIYVVCTRCIKKLNLRKEVGIAIKSKGTSSQFESVRHS